ncbi:MAG: hypothetical protein PHP22_03555 [Oscillospiraceae bacterium]|nr:hypothetical protein [Oscillospiraceae bacterium]
MTQDEADRLMGLNKIIDKTIQFPPQNKMAVYEASAIQGPEEFEVRVNRKGRLELFRCTFQESFLKKTILVRVDLDEDKPHLNPDREKIVGPHIHLYREGYDDRWAFLINDHIPQISMDSNLIDNFKHFCRFCNVLVNHLEQTIE